jgi:formylglycine-generating enzyme required for sulfatase activity
VQDYEVFVEETKRAWPKPQFEQRPTHPVVNVSWEDAQAFCAWLTARERRAARLGENEAYRLPTDHEWSCAVGIGQLEDPTESPIEKQAKIEDTYPWGRQWPPPVGAGNYAGEEFQTALDAGKYSYMKALVSGYRDDFVETAPVGSFMANQFGLFDMGGNAFQWCEDWYDKERKQRAMRGSPWDTYSRRFMLSSHRGANAPDVRNPSYGFRCVVGVSGNQ